MKAAELKVLLNSLPDDAELVIGDPCKGMYWNPVASRVRSVANWKAPEGWADMQIGKVQFFALLNCTTRASQGTNEGADSSGPRVLCL